MSCECVILNSIREFPKGLSFVLKDGYIASVPRKIKGLGGRTILDDYPIISIKVLLKTDMEIAIFLEWWTTEINYGTEDFTITVPFFGIIKNWKVIASGETREVLGIGTTRTIDMNLKILDDLDVAIAANILCEEC